MKFRSGQRVEVIGNVAGHNIPIGTVLTVRTYSGMYVRVAENTMNFNEADLRTVPATRKDLQEEFQVKEQQYLAARARLQYMENSRSKTLDEKEFRAYMIQQVLSNETLRIEDKQKQIESIFQE